VVDAAVVVSVASDSSLPHAATSRLPALSAATSVRILRFRMVMLLGREKVTAGTMAARRQVYAAAAVLDVD
jgi:hypothetical protein